MAVVTSVREVTEPVRHAWRVAVRNYLRSTRSAGLLLALGAGAATAQAPGAATQFRVRVPAGVDAQPITGRVYVMISRTDNREPRLQVGRTGIPFFGHDVVQLA
ncbi:MAG: hypothetical protein ACRENQ_16240, partial [Gemmatimonadaceae bacterium]